MKVLDRVREAAGKAELDAVLALSPENFYYCSGCPSYILYTGRIAGLAIVVVPTLESHDPVMIVNDFEEEEIRRKSFVKDIRTYPMWVDIDRGEETAEQAGVERKGESINPMDIVNLLEEALKDLNLLEGKIGVETLFVQGLIWDLLKGKFPKAKFLDCASVFYEARRVKTEEEIINLRNAAEIAEKAIIKTVEQPVMGATEEVLVKRFQMSVIEDVRSTGYRHTIINIGEFFSPTYFPRRNSAKVGDLVKFDVGADCRGYGSDIGRTFVVKKATPKQIKVHSALMKAHNAALEKVKPGVRMSEVFKVGQKVARENGLPRYTRGHIGHSISLDIKIEEPPFISPTEERVLEPGMVLCVELPYYGYKVGAIQIEDMIQVTEDGYEQFTKSSKELIEL
ncbi:MAG: M24 family metallopeptidase [Candidatus Jordarchaeaceae archaeon]